MREALVGAWVAVATFVPKLLLFLVILIIGMIVAKVVAKAIDKVLTRVGFDRAVERGGIKKALDKSKYDASAIVGKIVYYFLLLFVLQLAFGVFGSNPISELLTAIITFLPRLFVALIIVVLASAIAAAAKGLIQNTLGGLSYGRVLANIAGVFILGLGIIAALNQVGIATTVTTPVLIAVLGTIAGVLIVGVGGGLIKPMQQRWEGYLTKAEEEAPRIKEQAEAAPSVKDQAQQVKTQMQQQYDSYDDNDDPHGASGPRDTSYDTPAHHGVNAPRGASTPYDPNTPQSGATPQRY
jgi:Conserved TM helix